MLIAVDIGNTNIKFGVFDGSCEKLISMFSVSSAAVRTADEYKFIIKNFLGDDIIADASVISSVVPHITVPISEALASVCSKQPFIIGTGTRTGFPIRIDVQAQLGADIVSNAAGAFGFCRLKPPFAVVDMGTATTVTCVNSDGALIGTVIAPGADTSLTALLKSAALLSDAPLSKPSELIGKNSYDSIRSGAYYGTVYMIDGFIRNVRSCLCQGGDELTLVGTGGLCDILEDCRNKFTVVPDLTLRGAAALFYLNRSK